MCLGGGGAKGEKGRTNPNNSYALSGLKSHQMTISENCPWPTSQQEFDKNPLVDTQVIKPCLV